MKPSSSSSEFRLLIEQEVTKQLEAFKYRESAMIAHGLRQMLGERSPRLAPGIVVEDELAEAKPEDKNRLRVSSDAKPYLDDMRRAVILERWCDELRRCPGQIAAREVQLQWPDSAALVATLTANFMGPMERPEERLARVVLSCAAMIDSGDDYLLSLWDWLRESPERQSKGNPRLARIQDRTLIEDLCRAYLSRNLILPDDIDSVLQQCALSSVRARLKHGSEEASPTDVRPEDLIDAKDAAKLLGIKVATLNNKKSRGQIPPSVYVQPAGSRIKYRRVALLKWHRGNPSVKPPDQ